MTNCGSVQSLLDDFIDGTLPPASETAVRSHLEGCPQCRQEVNDLRELVHNARALRETPLAASPRSDLWPGIERRIAPARVRSSVLMVAAAAVVAAAVGAIIAMLALHQLPRETALAQHDPTSPQAAQRAALRAHEVQPSLASVDEEFERVRTELISVIESRRADLPQETADMIDENLQIIDAALCQIRAALEVDPSNTELRHLFVATYRKEIDFLQKMARFSAEGSA